jgi:hypothetical protein
VLTDYLAGHPDLNWQQKRNVLYHLASIAERMGDSKRAEQYRKAGDAMFPQQPPPGQILIGEEIRKAQEAATQHRWDDAYHLALHVIDVAAQAADWHQVAWFVPPIAGDLAANKEPAIAERLFQSLLGLAQNRKKDSIQPLIAATQNYARFLMSQPGRLGEVPAAIDQYRSVLTDANGPESASLAEPLRLKIEFALSQSEWERAAASAQELLELQESLSGNTSEPYLGDLWTAARVYEAAGDSLRALPLRRQAVAIADLLATSNNDWHRAQTRMDLALALAQLGQFDEALTLGEEAVALQQPSHSPAPPLTQRLEQIRQMKKAAAPVG